MISQVSDQLGAVHILRDTHRGRGGGHPFYHLATTGGGHQNYHVSRSLGRGVHQISHIAVKGDTGTIERC